MNTPGLTTLLVAAALPVAAETITFDKDPVGALPAGWVAGVTGRGSPKWAIEKDGTAPAAMKQMHARLKGSRYVELPGAGHISNMDRPAEFTRAVEEFLAA